jgi:predicted transcriptional regulator
MAKSRANLQACQECGKEFLFNQAAEEHRIETGHQLIIKESGEISIKKIDQPESPSISKAFRPNITTLERMMKVLLESDKLSRTSLAQASGIHYGRLAKYLDMLAYRNYLEYVMFDGKTIVRLTGSGRRFATNLGELGNLDEIQHRKLHA